MLAGWGVGNSVLRESALGSALVIGHAWPWQLGQPAQKFTEILWRWQHRVGKRGGVGGVCAPRGDSAGPGCVRQPKDRGLVMGHAWPW